MTRDEAKKLLPVIQAFAEGKEVQIKQGDAFWVTLRNPEFGADATEYRIKPEPLECWMVRFYDGSFSSRKSKELAEGLIRNVNGTHTIHHMREVI